MTWLAVSLALARLGPEPLGLPWYTGRLYTSERVHLGVRPAAFVDNEDNGRLEGGLGVTVQVTTRAL